MFPPPKKGDASSSGRRPSCMAIVPFGVDLDSLDIALGLDTPKSDGIVSSMPAPSDPGSPSGMSEKAPWSEPLPGLPGNGSGTDKTSLPFHQTVCAVKTCRQVICRQPSRCHDAKPKSFEICVASVVACIVSSSCFRHLHCIL